MNRWILGALLLVVGCKVSDPQAVKSPPPVAKPHAADSIATALRRHTQLWVSQKVRDYQYTLTGSLSRGTGPVKIAVRDGKTQAVKCLKNARGSGIPFDPTAFNDYNTIDKIFQTIEGQLARKVHHIEVTYDPRFGYPTEVILGWDMPEGYSEIRIRDFKNIPESPRSRRVRYGTQDSRGARRDPGAQPEPGTRIGRVKIAVRLAVGGANHVDRATHTEASPE